MSPSRLALALALVSCRPPSPAVAPAPAPAAPEAAAVVDAGPPVAVAPPAAPADPCASLLARHRAAIANVGGPDSPWTESIASFGRCLPTPRGLWAVVVDDAAYVEDADQGNSVRGHWSVVRVGADGAELRLTRAAEWISRSLPGVTGAVVYDYDGDGEAELVLLRRTSVSEGADDPDGEVLTVRGGAVVPYAPAAGIEPDEARDVDADGRPDLVTRTPYRADGDDSPSDFTYLMEGPALLAHALPDGSFSRSDAVAAGFAREQCPRRDASAGGATIDGASVVCARLWGVPAATVAGAVRARCPSPAQSGSGSPGRRHCGDTRVLLRWAAATPPLALR
jgi:hypothetical protein